MSAEKTTLENGVRILTRKMPHARSVSLGVWVETGARDENPAESGLSHFIEHMIFKGTARRTSFQIAREFDSIGGQTNAFTSLEATCYHARVMDAHLATMVDILSDIFLSPVFDPLEVERERAVIFQEIGMTEDSPEEYIHVLSESAFWGDHAMGRPITGTRENILGFSAADIRNFFHRLYHPERIVIAASGNLEHNRIVDLIGPAFASVQKQNSFPNRTKPQGRSGVFLHPRDTEQVHICMETDGLSATDPRRYAASLMNTILGGNMSSRLFQEIREQRGLAYSVYSFLSSYTDTGVSGIYAGTSADTAAEAVDLILSNLKKLKNTPVDTSELRDAGEYTKGSLMLAAESVDNQMVRLAQNEIHLGCHQSLEEIIAEMEAVTAEDIMGLAQELYRSDPMTITLLGPVSDPALFEDLLIRQG
ncbi:MAG: M16 family metallopeptidase [Desulfococcaceae bacterium]